MDRSPSSSLDKEVKPKDVRKARAFLSEKGLNRNGIDIPPRAFAVTAKKTGKKFLQLLKEIARLKMGGQGQGQSAETKAAIEE